MCFECLQMDRQAYIASQNQDNMNAGNDDAERRNTHEFVTKFPSKIKPINDSNFNFGK